MEIAGKVAVITGAASGIGRAVATELARRNVRALALVDMGDNIEGVAAGVNAEAGRRVAYAYHGDVTDAEFRAWHGCLRFTDAAVRALDVALAAEHGISVKEFDVLITLFNATAGRLRMTELAEHVVLTQSGVTHLVTRLERDGLVTRVVDEDDRRSFFAALTRAGHRRLREARPTHNEVVRAHLTRRLTRAQLKALGALWDSILEP